jgi:hypothetical protein
MHFSEKKCTSWKFRENRKESSKEEKKNFVNIDDSDGIRLFLALKQL